MAHPLVGWTALLRIYDATISESIGHVSGARYHAQIDNIVMSIEVTGPFVDFNFDAAHWLLESQANCVQQDTSCAPTSMPMGDADWKFVGELLHFSDPASGDDVEARWIFPLEAPVITPEWSVTIP